MDGLGLLLGVVLFTLGGSMLGMLTGLTPGLHVNLVAQVLFLISGSVVVFLSEIGWIQEPLLLVGCLIVACSITHTFLDIIPSVFLGAPDPDSGPVPRLPRKGRLLR